MTKRNRIGAIMWLGTLTACASFAIAQPVPPASQPASQPTTRPRGRPRPPLPPASPADTARLNEQGKRSPTSHDPSTIVRCKDQYWMFNTGNGINSWHSPDLVTWMPGPRVFEVAPSWVKQTVPLHRGTHFWAPDVIQMADDRYLLFYSVSTFGKQTSAIAVASNVTLDPNDPNFRWIDGGIVVQSNETMNFNAIDPAVFRDDDGQLWMSFGSFWSGIKLIELDPQTGKRVNDTQPIALAHKNEIEAPFIAKHGGRYYLFVSWGICCRGVNSTYEIRVGRSEKVEGPYLDRSGKPMTQDGGTPVLATDGKFIGPGHPGIVTDDAGKEWLSCHFYDATEGGQVHLALRPLTWDAAGWPVVK